MKTILTMALMFITLSLYAQVSTMPLILHDTYLKGDGTWQCAVHGCKLNHGAADIPVIGQGGVWSDLHESLDPDKNVDLQGVIDVAELEILIDHLKDWQQANNEERCKEIWKQIAHIANKYKD